MPRWILPTQDAKTKEVSWDAFGFGSIDVSQPPYYSKFEEGPESVWPTLIANKDLKAGDRFICLGNYTYYDSLTVVQALTKSYEKTTTDVFHDMYYASPKPKDNSKRSKEGIILLNGSNTLNPSISGSQIVGGQGAFVWSRISPPPLGYYPNVLIVSSRDTQKEDSDLHWSDPRNEDFKGISQWFRSREGSWAWHMAQVTLASQIGKMVRVSDVELVYGVLLEDVPEGSPLFSMAGRYLIEPSVSRMFCGEMRLNASSLILSHRAKVLFSHLSHLDDFSGLTSTIYRILKRSGALIEEDDVAKALASFDMRPNHNSMPEGLHTLLGDLIKLTSTIGHLPSFSSDLMAKETSSNLMDSLKDADLDRLLEGLGDGDEPFTSPLDLDFDSLLDGTIFKT